MRVGYDRCRAEVLRRVEGQERIVGCCRAIDWKNGECRCVHHRGHRAEVPVGYYPAACLQHSSGATYYCLRSEFVSHEQYCILRRNDGFVVAPHPMDREVSEEERRGYRVQIGYFCARNPLFRVVMCDDRGGEILGKHGWTLYKRFHFQDSEGPLGWVTRFDGDCDEMEQLLRRLGV